MLFYRLNNHSFRVIFLWFNMSIIHEFAKKESQLNGGTDILKNFKFNIKLKKLR